MAQTHPSGDRPSRLVRPQQSTIRLRRLGTTARTNHGNAGNPQGVRSMLDVDGPSYSSRDEQIIAPSRPDDCYVQQGSHYPQPNDGHARPRIRSMLTIGEDPGLSRENRNVPQVLVPSIQQPAPIQELQGTPATQFIDVEPQDAVRDDQETRNRGRFNRLRRRSLMGMGLATQDGEVIPARRYQRPIHESGYDSQIVDLLDVIDPEVETLCSITNVQNSLFVPSLGRFVNRRPTYNLTRAPQPPGAYPRDFPDDIASVDTSGREGRFSELTTPMSETAPQTERPAVERIPSDITERFFAVRPRDTSFADWSDEDLAELNDHVRHMLHSRGSAFRRRLRAFGQYVRKPLGFFVTLYATLITLFGLAWVLFLIGWIYVGERQLYVIDVIDNVLVALFAVVGDGMIPWRIIDTYHMYYIARYHHRTWKLRDKMAIPNLKDKNDLPSTTVHANGEPCHDVDLETAREIHTKKELSVLTPQQQAELDHHQTRFSKSHTFYKPHETETHFAFPLRFLVAIVVLLDLHSCFQIALGLCTWCIDYHVRPMALTATILSCSITVNIMAGVLISIGDKKTRKKDVVERMFRQELTEEAMREVRERKETEARKAEKKSRLERVRENDEDELEGRSSASRSRKSVDRVGKFDPAVHTHGTVSDSDSSHIPGAFPKV